MPEVGCPMSALADADVRENSSPIPAMLRVKVMARTVPLGVTSETDSVVVAISDTIAREMVADSVISIGAVVTIVPLVSVFLNRFLM